MTYRELYDEVIDSGKYFGPKKEDCGTGKPHLSFQIRWG